MNALIGPQVAIIDDVYDQVAPLESVFKELNIGTQFFNARPDLAEYPESPIESIQLVLLDLHYKHDFDAEMCVQWIHSIISPNQKYSLLLWTRDTDKENDVLRLLNQYDLAPEKAIAWQKTNFDLKNHDFRNEVVGLINDVSSVGHIQEEIIHGEVIDLEDDGVLINCRINEEHPTFQVRKFDADLLSNIEKIMIGTYVRIYIYTKPGARLFNFFEEKKDNSDLFKQEDFFKGLEGGSFFKEG